MNILIIFPHLFVLLLSRDERGVFLFFFIALMSRVYNQRNHILTLFRLGFVSCYHEQQQRNLLLYSSNMYTNVSMFNIVQAQMYKGVY